MKKKRKLYERSLKNWKYILSHFTPEYIEKMTDMREYVIGFGSSNKSFCYLVEAGTKELGDIRGATASKFGLWYGAHGNDRELKYRATIQYFNSDTNTAFSKIKNEISNVIKTVQKQTEFKEIESFLSPMFKYKIMYLYNDKVMLPSFSFCDLQHFEDCLGLKISKTFEDSQKQLMNYRNSNLSQLNNYDFIVYLYETYGKLNIKQTKDFNELADERLNKKIAKEKAYNGEYSTHPVEKVELIQNNSSLIYPRDVMTAQVALKNANYKCEFDSKHKCFIRRSNNLPYTEVHHLIPLAYHYKFDKSLDVPENVVSLCSNCHNEIHYGKNAGTMISMFYNARKEKLHEAGIDITLDELLEMYQKLGSD